VLAGAEEAGAQARLFQLGGLEISPCKACMGCRKTARCVVEDDMQRFYEAVESVSEPKGLVVGTPIYFDHVSAQLKTWLDRLYCYTYTERGEKAFPSGFRAVLVATWEWDKEDAYDPVLDWLEGRLKGYHAIETVGRIRLAGSGARPAKERDDLAAQARACGRQLVAGI
jgi:multimeric flavodoxin WrbA